MNYNLTRADSGFKIEMSQLNKMKLSVDLPWGKRMETVGLNQLLLERKRMSFDSGQKIGFH